jgi:AraC-like DNA-binding protein
MRSRRKKACRSTRNARRLSADLLQLDQKVLVSGSEQGLDATGRFWLLAAVQVRRGTVLYISDDDKIACPGQVFGVSVPPFSVLEVILNQTDTDSRAFVSTEPLSPDLPCEPIAFDIAVSKIPDTIPDLLGHFARRSVTSRIGRCRRPSPLALRVKAALEQGYSRSMPLSVVAAELGSSASAMSRAFKRCYGMPPVRYRHLLRTMDGMMRLLNGERIVSVCHDVGFGDLSRFYRQFKRYTLSQPSSYQF